MRGFTLLELVIVIAIMAGIAVIASPNLRNISISQRLKQSSTQLMSDLVLTQSNASSGYVQGINCDTYIVTGTTQRIYTTANQWRLIMQKGGRTNPGSSYTIEWLCPTVDVAGQPKVGIFKTSTLPKDVYIDTVSNGDGCLASFGAQTKPTISFSNVQTTVKFDYGSTCVTSNKMEIILKSTSTSDTSSQKIIIEKGGAIYIQ